MACVSCGAGGHATVLAPSHPGFGHTDCPAWLSSVQHQAVFYNWFLQAAGLESVDLVGIGVGGWIAAQMAVMCSASLRHLVLVDAAGVRPEQGEILDVFVTPWKQVIEQAFADPQAAPEYARIYGGGIAEFGGVREAGRTMSMRMCFRPYMYDPALPGMLGKVQVPTLIVWGKEDRIVPLECAFSISRRFRVQPCAFSTAADTLRTSSSRGSWQTPSASSSHHDHPVLLLYRAALYRI